MRYKQLLAGAVPANLLEELPNGFCVIGDIAIVQIPPCCWQYRAPVAEAVISTRKNIRTILAKISLVQGS